VSTKEEDKCQKKHRTSGRGGGHQLPRVTCGQGTCQTPYLPKKSTLEGVRSEHAIRKGAMATQKGDVREEKMQRREKKKKKTAESR